MSAKTQSTLKAVLLALFIALTVVTWILSLVPGNVSAEQSDAVGNFVAGILPYYTFEPVQSLVINHPQQLYNVGDTVQLQLSFYPNNASYPLVIWQSLDTNVALISYNGEITFIGEGSAKFVATYAFDDSIYTDITLTCSSQMLCPIGDKRGDSIKILTKPTVPINYWTQLSALSTTTSESVFPVWSVEDESIAAIIDNNYIVGKTAGQTTLIAQYGDIEERIIVDIYYDNSIGFAEGIELGAITDKLQVYHELQLDAILVADNTSSVLDYIIWESDNPAIATVDKGIVYGKSPGTTKIYAKWYLDDNIKNYFEVTVTDILPQGISVIAPTILSKNEYELIHVQFDNNPFDKRVSFFRITKKS